MSVSLTLDLCEVHTGLWARRKQTSFQWYFVTPPIRICLHYLTQKRTLIRTRARIDVLYSQSLAGRDFKGAQGPFHAHGTQLPINPLIESW